MSEKKKRKLNLFGKKKRQTVVLDSGSEFRADVFFYYMGNPKPDPLPQAKVKIHHSLPSTSKIEVNKKIYHLNCSVEDIKFEKPVIGISYLGWFAGAMLFFGFDIYRMLHEFFSVTWDVGLADAIYLICFSIPVFGWSISLADKKYTEINLCWNTLTGIWSSVGKQYMILAEQQSLFEGWVLLLQLQKRFDRYYKFKWVSEDFQSLIKIIQLSVSKIVGKIDRAQIDPTKIESAWQGLDDIVNIFEPKAAEKITEEELKERIARKEELLTIINSKGVKQ